ncbi:hypothetical protein Golob_018006 [Gossypium lobatum]|uniref:Uncharacterized protein n=1 Tax=Gossypium lobatum TaxID=34289 RepID=A0A7J8M8W2_9ROSI|nr:hypothetical protein [Gossypium lobatum]
MFEMFNVPGLYIVVNYILALAIGYTTSKVCDWFSIVFYFLVLYIFMLVVY